MGKEKIGSAPIQTFLVGRPLRLCGPSCGVQRPLPPPCRQSVTGAPWPPILPPSSARGCVRAQSTAGRGPLQGGGAVLHWPWWQCSSPASWPTRPYCHMGLFLGNSPSALACTSSTHTCTSLGLHPARFHPKYSPHLPQPERTSCPAPPMWPPSWGSAAVRGSSSTPAPQGHQHPPPHRLQTRASRRWAPGAARRAPSGGRGWQGVRAAGRQRQEQRLEGQGRPEGRGKPPGGLPSQRLPTLGLRKGDWLRVCLGKGRNLQTLAASYQINAKMCVKPNNNRHTEGGVVHDLPCVGSRCSALL